MLPATCPPLDTVNTYTLNLFLKNLSSHPNHTFSTTEPLWNLQRKLLLGPDGDVSQGIAVDEGLDIFGTYFVLDSG